MEGLGRVGSVCACEVGSPAWSRPRLAGRRPCGWCVTGDSPLVGAAEREWGPVPTGQELQRAVPALSPGSRRGDRSWLGVWR